MTLVCLAFYLSGFAISGTLYYALEEGYSVKLYVKYGTYKFSSATLLNMEDTGETFNGWPVYSVTFNNEDAGYGDVSDEVGELCFEVYYGSSAYPTDEETVLYRTTAEGGLTDLSDYDGKLKVHGVDGMQALNFDRTVIVHYKNWNQENPENIWSSVYCKDYYNNGTSNVSVTPLHGYETTANVLLDSWYDYKITGRPCTHISFNDNGANSTEIIAIGNSTEYWVVDGPTSTTATSIAPTDYCYNRPITLREDGTFGTVCLPYDAIFDSKNTFVLEVTGKIVKDDTMTGLTLATVDTIKAGIPYIFQVKNKDHFTASLRGISIDEPINDPENPMLGTFTDIVEIPVGSYIVKDNELHKVVDGSNAKIKDYRAYINADKLSALYPTEAQGKFFLFFANATSGVEDVLIMNNQESAVYNLKGQRVEDNQQGLVISNGKVVLRKQ